MAADTLSALRGLETSVLTEVVRQDQQEPELEITNWSVRPLSNKGIIHDVQICLKPCRRGKDAYG